MSETQLSIVLVFSVFLCLSVLIRSVHYRRLAQKNLEELTKAELHIAENQKKIDELELVRKKFSDFQTSLYSAELTTNMQKTRLVTARQPDELKIPERYSYIHALSKKGVEPEDIASILSISPHEASQLVALANLAEK